MAEMGDEVESKRGGYRLIFIPGGSFAMGSAESERGRLQCEGPLHRVVVPGFFLGRCPVTNSEYQFFLKDNPDVPEPVFFGDKGFNHPAQPVVGVSFDDATRYCSWAGLRLPSEAEWEYACRAGTTTRYHCGNRSTELRCVAWYSRVARRRLHAVGKKAPNAFGLYDMHGNVWEWCVDDWHDTYAGAPDDGQPWVDSVRQNTRVLRGGSWFGNHADYLRSACRRAGDAELAEFNLGFRCALTPD